MTSIRAFCLVFVYLIVLPVVSAQLRLPRLLSDHMVLQRDQPITIWGWAAAGASVQVKFADQQQTTRANLEGHWRVKLAAMPAGGPYRLQVRSGAEEAIADNILLGDVWICSGQSNMEWTVSSSSDARREIAAASDPLLRHYKVPRAGALYPQDTLPGGQWEITTPETAGDFTAVGYYFARELRRSTGIPIGLINTSWGGSRIEPWMDAHALGYKDVAELAAKLEARQAGQVKELTDFLTEKLGSIPSQDIGMQSGQPIWHDPQLDDSHWQTMNLPGLWETKGWAPLDGIVWFRTELTLTPEQAGSPAVLGLAMIDDNDITWINGKKVGQTNRHNTTRRYQIPSGILQPGRNVIAVRVEDTGGGGGFHGAPDHMFLQIGAQQLNLAGDWKYRVGKAQTTPAGFSDNQQPGKLYHAMIHPLLWYPIRGAIWYQGESNANNVSDATAYQDLFMTMIKRWRELWGIGDFPFFYVQLANFRQNTPQPANTAWATIRESQSKALQLPNTAQAVIIDIGEANDIHPGNKQDVGRRLALAARKLIYGEEDLVYSGPVYRSMNVEGNRIRLTFDHVGSGLEARHDKYGYLRGFAIAGADQKFVWAKAMIDGYDIVVWSDEVMVPVAVRYAWSDNPDDANLYNEEGLPAGPFRTDSW